MNILTRDDTKHDVEYVLASEARAIEEERDELLSKVHSLEFRLSQEKHLNTDHEQDYLAVWKLIKRPNETVIQAVQRVKAENEAMRAAIKEAVHILEEQPQYYRIDALAKLQLFLP